jgi:hypothetical protein
MNSTFIIIGVIIGVLSITALIGYLLIVPAILSYYEPEPGSNEALKNWLLSNPGADIDDYLHNKSDRCVIR